MQLAWQRLQPRGAVRADVVLRVLGLSALIDQLRA